MEKIMLDPETIREKMKLNQEDFVKLIGITVPTYNRRLADGGEWKYRELLKISLASGIPIDYIDVGL